MVEIKRLVMGMLATNTYIIKKRKSVLIVDPTGNSDKISSHINEEEKVVAIVLTHGHFDHIGAVDDLVKKYNCEVYLNSEDIELATTRKLNSFNQYSAVINSPIKSYHEGKMNIGDFELMIYFAPGHTAGCTLIGIENHLFTGDVLFKEDIGRTDLYSANERDMKKTLQFIKTLDENYIVYPGHEELTTLKHELVYNPHLR